MFLSQLEEKILDFWQKEKIFEKLKKERKKQKAPYYSFYDGPPFATGLPHYGHILATTIKDSVVRFWAMMGYQVEPRVGWDCHGLPIEHLIEKELDIRSKREIEEKVGIEKFNKVCRSSVFRCLKDFEKTLQRVGRWADYQNAYATMDNDYIESVWWVFKQLYDLGLIYREFRVVPYCPRCGTPLSNFEVNQGYQEVEDQSVFVKVPVKEKKNRFLLIWTTTPWTLPGNVAIAVNPRAEYVVVKINNQELILAKARLKLLLGDQKYQIREKIKGSKLEGLRYDPLFSIPNKKTPYTVLSANFVSLEDGTGLVHIAPAFGEDDFNLVKRQNYKEMPILITVDQEGKIKKGLKIPGEGKFVKEADEDIIKDLQNRKLLWKKDKIVHNYPFCWRCDSLLLYYPIDTWYVAVTKIKKELVANNEKIHWMPRHIKYGRFGKWLKGARDWAVSRNRFWGAPIPVWICKKCKEVRVIGSIKELEVLTKKKIKDLHRPYVDELRLQCSNCKGKMERVREVFDCWFESGSMPYAQWHYPFENKKLVEETFPADFIAEGMDQTRGWFYTLHVLATALTLQDIGLGKNQPAFKNVIVNGLILGEDGKKLSKRLKNYPDVSLVLNKYGADSLRYFLLSSTPIGEDYILSEKRIEETYRKVLMTFWNSFAFWEIYSDEKIKIPRSIRKPKGILEEWILSRLHQTIREIREEMKVYDLTKAVRPIGLFIDDLSNWYIRRSRRKFQRPEKKQDKKQALKFLGHILFELTKISAPFVPFISEAIYQRLPIEKKKASVHLEEFPEFQKRFLNERLIKDMEKTRDVVQRILAERAKAGIKVRQPLALVRIENPKFEAKNKKALLKLVKEEVNVKEIIIGKRFYLDKKLTPELLEEGIVREVIRQIQDLRRKKGLTPRDKIKIGISGDREITGIVSKQRRSLQKEVLASNLEIGKDYQRFWREIEINGKKIRISLG